VGHAARGAVACRADHLRDFDRAWERAAPYSGFGLRRRWLAAVASLSGDWPVLRYPPYGGQRRWRLGEVTLPWAALAPASIASGGGSTRIPPLPPL